MGKSRRVRRDAAREISLRSWNRSVRRGSSLDEPGERFRAVSEWRLQCWIDTNLAQRGFSRSERPIDDGLQLSRLLDDLGMKAHRARDTGNVEALLVSGRTQRLAPTAQALARV